MSYNNFLYLLNDALSKQDIALALDSVKTFKAADLADILAQLPLENSQKLLLHLPARAYVFSYFKPEEQVKFAHGLTRTDLAEIMGEMPSDKRVDLFKCLDHEQQNTRSEEHTSELQSRENL